MLYGFTLIVALSKILDASILWYMHYGFENSFYMIHFKYYVPVFALAIYGGVALVIAILWHRGFNFRSLLKPLLFFLALVLILVFDLFSERVSNSILESYFNNNQDVDHISSLDLTTINYVVKDAMSYAKWIGILMLIGYFYFRSKRNAVK